MGEEAHRLIWLTWRQHRGEAYIVTGLLALLAILLLVTGRDMIAAYQQLGVGDCIAHPDHPNCGMIVEAFAHAQQHVDFQGAFTACTHAHGWQMFITYQPASRFLLFAGIETGIFAVLAVALAGLTVWWVWKRLS